MQVSISVIGDFLLQNEMTVYLVVYDKASFVLSGKLFSSIAQYIDDNYVEEHYVKRTDMIREDYQQIKRYAEPQKVVFEEALSPFDKNKRSLEDIVKHMDETFSQILLRLIDEKGMTDAEAYKKANVDRKLFSKIRSNINYKPSKPTAIAFAIALKLNLDETQDLLRKAGYALSNSNKFDIIIQYFIEEGNYNILKLTRHCLPLTNPYWGYRKETFLCRLPVDRSVYASCNFECIRWIYSNELDVIITSIDDEINQVILVL